MQSRLMGIDTIRGLLLIMMTIDHLLAWPFACWPTFFAHSYGPLGFFSAAEGFFFISGLIAGLLLRTKPTSMLGSLDKRLVKLYGANLLGLSVLGLGAYFLPTFFQQWGESPSVQSFFQNPLKAVFFSALFLYLPSFFDILPVYFIFFISLPFIYRFLQKGHVAKLLGCSFVLWGMGQYAPWQRLSSILNEHTSLIKLGWFDIVSWQFIFLLGLLCGYFSEYLITQFKEVPNYVTTIAISFCVLCFIGRHYYLLDYTTFSAWIDVRTLGPLRLLNFLVAAYCVSVAVRTTKIFYLPYIAFLGRWSLPVFLYHSVLVYILGAFTNQIASTSLPIKILIFSISLFSLWMPALISQYKNAIKEYVYLMLKPVKPSIE